MRQGSYAFIYDDLVSDKKYERELAAIESRLAFLDIQGRVSRMALFRSAKELVQSMATSGVQTVVVVGNDLSLDKVMWFLPEMGVTVGYIPLAGPSEVASLLGIPVGAAACDVLGARLIETVDMGRIDDRYFLTEVSFSDANAQVDIEGRYRISSTGKGTISVRNLGRTLLDDAKESNIQDGQLEVVVTPEAEKAKRGKAVEPVPETRILARSVQIIAPNPIQIRVDDHALQGSHFSVDIQPSALRLITGRRRRLPTTDPLLQSNVKRYTFPAATRDPRSFR